MKPYGLMADLHLHEWSSFSQTTEDGQNSRLVALLGEIARCCIETHAAGGDTVVMAGDIFHVRGSVSPSVLNALRDCLRRLHTTFGAKFIVLAGNHDIQGKNTTRLGSAVTALECDYVQTVNAGINLGDMVLVPWIESVDALKQVLVEWSASVIDSSELDLILHAPIDGVIKGLPEYGLTPEFLAGLGFKRVFSGHYHNHKVFEGKVHSIGALAHHTWSDINSKAGFLLVHPERVEWRKSHLPEFIDLSQLVDLAPEDIPFMVDRNYVRVKVEASKSSAVEAARQELLDMGAIAVIVQSSPAPPVRPGLERASVAAGGSLEVSVTEFIKSMPGVAIDAVTKAALDVLAAVDSTKE